MGTAIHDGLIGGRTLFFKQSLKCSLEQMLLIVALNCFLFKVKQAFFSTGLVILNVSPLALRIFENVG